MLVTSSPAERVKDAALICDLVKPGWAEIVDVDTFDMSGTTSDIAAHLNLPYTLDYDDQSTMSTLYSLGLMPLDGEDWSQINDAWMTEIFDRRTVKP